MLADHKNQRKTGFFNIYEKVCQVSCDISPMGTNGGSLSGARMELKRSEPPFLHLFIQPQRCQSF
jgi:hypothetical protein